MDVYAKLRIFTVFGTEYIKTGNIPCGTIAAPASFPNVIAAGSVQLHMPGRFVLKFIPRGAKGPGVNGRTKPDLVAPRWSYGPCMKNPKNQCTHRGSNIATSHVSGILVLLVASSMGTPADIRRFCSQKRVFLDGVQGCHI